MGASDDTLDGRTPLLERERELSELGRLVDATLAGAGRVVVIEGVAGIGKSRLLDAFCDHANTVGVRVLYARGGELERDLGWRVVRELFTPVVAAMTEADAQALLSGTARFAEPVLALTSYQVPPTGADSVAAALQGLYWLAADLAAQRPLLLAVDDVQWADLPSLRWLAHLAARIEGLPLLVALTTRPIEPAADGTRLSVTSDVTPLSVLAGLALLLKLAPLSETAGVEMVRLAIGSDADYRFAAACHMATGGNPFLLGELLGALLRDGVSATAENAERVQGIAPETVARAVLLRLSRLSEDATKLATAVAVLGKEVSMRQAALLADLDQDRAAHASAALSASDILLDRLPLEFVHPVVRSAVYQDLPAATRTRWHERAAELLATTAAPDTDVAVHLLHTEPEGAQRTVQALVRAAEDELNAGAPDAAVTFLRRALRESPSSQGRARLLQLLGHAETLTGGPQGFETLRLAYRTAKDPRERAEIALDHARAVGMVDDFRSAVEPLRHVLDQLEAGSPLAAEVEAELMRIAFLDLSTLPILVELLGPYLSHPESVDDPAILGLLALAATGTGNPGAAEAAALARRALAAGELVNPGTAVYVAGALAATDDLVSAIEIWDRFAARAQASGSMLAYGFACIHRSYVRYHEGALAAAEEDARAAVDIFRDWAPPTQALGFYVEVLSERDAVAGEAALEEIELPDELPEIWGNNSLLFGRGRLRLAQGRYPEALRDLLECGRRASAWGCLNPAPMPWRAYTALALAASGEGERASELANEDVERARAFGAAGALGQSLRAAGLVEGGTTGLEILEEAASILRGSPLRLELARTLCDYGAFLRRAGHRGDALEPLREALDLASRCGATALVERTRAELVTAGARPRRDTLRGRDALTASELRVAEMAAAGMTNREIAQALFVTLRTVETHLTHAYQKLDIVSRAELADSLATAEASSTAG